MARAETPELHLRLVEPRPGAPAVQSQPTIRVGVIDDDEGDYLLVRHSLARTRRAYEVEWFSSYAAGLAAVQQGGCEVFLVDGDLADHPGIELIEEARRSGSGAALLVVSSTTCLDEDLRAFASGADDYLGKDELTPSLLDRAIRYALGHRAQTSEILALQRRYEAAIEGAHDGIWDWNPHTGELFVSPRCLEMLDLPRDASSDRQQALWKARIVREDLAMLLRAFHEHLAGGTRQLSVEYRVRCSTGTETIRWMYVRGVAQRDAMGEVIRVAGSQSDITERKRTEEEVRYRALHDELTGLPNRKLLYDRLERCLVRARRELAYGFAVLFVDLDGFKAINDQHGHAAGDAVLQAVAERARAVLRESDTVARMGGDEFVVLVDACPRWDGAWAVSDKLAAALSVPVAFGGRGVHVGVSIGISLCVDGTTDADSLMRAADADMYATKARKRSPPEAL